MLDLLRIGLEDQTGLNYEPGRVRPDKQGPRFVFAIDVRLVTHGSGYSNGQTKVLAAIKRLQRNIVLKTMNEIHTESGIAERQA